MNHFPKKQLGSAAERTTKDFFLLHAVNLNAVFFPSKLEDLLLRVIKGEYIDP